MKTLFYKRHNLPQNPAILILAFCILLFTNMQCKKDKLPIDQLPAATQTGANTFGCLVDGEAVIPTNNVIYRSNFDYGYDPDYGLSIEASNEASNHETLRTVSIKLLIKNLKEGQTYSLDSLKVSGKGGASYTLLSDYGRTTTYYETSSQATGSLTITKFDLSKKIISGTFLFKATNTVNNTIANVTDGRFDLTFK